MRFDRQAKYALIVACLTLLASRIGFSYAVSALKIYLQKEPVWPRETFAGIPSRIGDWEMVGDDAKYDEALIEALGTEYFIDRSYIRTGDPKPSQLNVHLAYYTGMIDAVPHVPDRCFVAAGLSPQSQSEEFSLAIDFHDLPDDAGSPNLATGQAYKVVEHRHPFTNELQMVRMPVGELKLRLTEFGRADQPGMKVFGGFLFIANGRATATPEDIRLLAFKPSERYAYYCKVQFVYAAPGATRERYLELVSDFMQDFLPELMLRLPDWREIEQRGRGETRAASPSDGSSASLVPIGILPSGAWRSVASPMASAR